MRSHLLLALGLIGLLALPPAALAACPQTTLDDLEDEVMCTVCGTPLGLATEAPQAQRERALIERLIARCRSKDEIKGALAAQFGRRVLATPDGVVRTLFAWWTIDVASHRTRRWTEASTSRSIGGVPDAGVPSGAERMGMRGNQIRASGVEGPSPVAGGWSARTSSTRERTSSLA